MENMPSFNREETRMILEYIRDRNMDPNDPYTLYITENNLFNNGLIVGIFQGKGIIVEYTQQTRQEVVNNVLIESPELNQVFIDYIENHISKSRALSNMAATEFLNELIEKYLDIM